MTRRFWSVPTLALLAITAAAVAKPPDLPQKLKITVDAAPASQALAGFELICPEAAPDRHVRGAFDVAAGRSVLENLDLLMSAGERLEKARKHAKAGEVGEALECVAWIMKAVPGSNVAEACDEVVADVTTCLARATPYRPDAGCEEAAEEGCCCPLMAWLGWVNNKGLCWLSRVGHGCPACPSARGKGVMVDGLLKAAHLAMGDGRVEKARELVKQAHALDAERVEADPLVYKMHLLPLGVAAPAGGEERSEPLPTHPKQKNPKKPVICPAPNMPPGVCPDFMEAMEQALKGAGGK